jgi:NDP-sugar pyrophosphorylase family protein
MRAGIIAAGDGSRLREGGFAVPKPLVQVGGVSLIERALRGLAEAGVAEVALILNPRMPEVAEFVRGLPLGVPVQVLERATPSSMHSLHELRPYLEGDRFVLCTVDSVLAPGALAGFVRGFEALPELELYLGVTNFVDDEKPLYIRLADDGRVEAIGQAALGSPLVTAGLYGMSSRAFPVLERAVAAGRERLRNFLAMLLEEGFSARGHQLGKVVDVDRPSDLEVAESFLRDLTGREPCS